MYQLNFISSVSDCDTLLNEAQNIKGGLDIRKASLISQIDAYANSELAGNLQAEITSLQNQLIGYQSALELVPLNSPQWFDLRLDIVKGEKELRGMNERAQRINPEKQVERQNNLVYVEEQLLEVDLWMAAIETRKTEIQSAPAA